MVLLFMSFRMADYWDEHSRRDDNGSEDMIDFIRQLNTGKNMNIFKY